MSRSCALAIVLVLFPGVAAIAAEADEARLTKELGSADADRVLDYLKGQLLNDDTRKKVTDLIKQLGDANFRTRQEATRKLVEIGQPALPQLRAATSNSDKEVSDRSKRCITEIQHGPRYDLPIVAIRWLARLKDQRAVELMLALLPESPEEPFHADILEALGQVGVSGKEVHPAVRKALDDPRLRAAAVQILLKSDDAALRKKMKEYLKDKDPAVRFHVAMSLLRHGDRDAVPALIEVLGESPSVTLWQQAEEALYATAGDIAPAIPIKSGAADERKEASEQWAAWWRQKGDQVLLGRKDDYPTDVCAVAETGARNRVFEWRPEGKPRFNITDLVGPVDVRVLPGKRLLIAEQNGRRVTERDFNGKIIWEQPFDEGPVSVMRLPNGNTFVATMQRVMEVRRNGDVVYSYPVEDGVSDANKLTDGRIALISTDDAVIFLGADGKEIKRATADSQGAIEAQPNGHVLVSQTQTGRVTEFDAKGEKILDLKIDGAWMATRLPDGNLLVASKSKRKMTKIDRSGKVIAEYDVDGQPHSIHWR
jgi:HEAT repeat protein